MWGARRPRTWRVEGPQQNHYTPKIYKSPINEIAYDTFNTGASKHAALITKSRKKCKLHPEELLG